MQRGSDSGLKVVSRSGAEHGFASRKALAMSRFLMAAERAIIDPEDHQDIIETLIAIRG